MNRRSLAKLSVAAGLTGILATAGVVHDSAQRIDANPYAAAPEVTAYARVAAQAVTERSHYQQSELLSGSIPLGLRQAYDRYRDSILNRALQFEDSAARLDSASDVRAWKSWNADAERLPLVMSLSAATVSLLLAGLVLYGSTDIVQGESSPHTDTTHAPPPA